LARNGEESGAAGDGVVSLIRSKNLQQFGSSRFLSSFSSSSSSSSSSNPGSWFFSAVLFRGTSDHINFFRITVLLFDIFTITTKIFQLHFLHLGSFIISLTPFFYFWHLLHTIPTISSICLLMIITRHFLLKQVFGNQSIFH